MTTPDLSGATATVLRLMTDAVTVTRDAQGVGDDVLNETTGQLVRPAGDTSTVWSGPAMLLPGQDRGDRTVLGPTDPLPAEVAGRYRALLPLSVPRLLPGDLLTVTTAFRDALLVGRVLRVRSEGELSTFAVARVVELELLP